MEMVNGRDPMESAATLLETVIDAFNPVGGTNSILNFISPTITDPFVDLTRNRDFADRPIMPEESQFGPDTPENQRYWGSVAPHWKAVTAFLNEVSGGDDVVPGAIDVSPEVLEHMQGVVLGAAGSFLDRNIGLAGKLLDPEAETELNDWPMGRKLVGQKPGWYDKAAYYTRVDEIEQQIAYAKDYAERGDAESLGELIQNRVDLLSLEPAVKATKKDMRALRKDRTATEQAYELGQIDVETYRNTIAIIETAEQQVIDGFNTLYLQTVETPARPTR
jgi:hypothetical protein